LAATLTLLDLANTAISKSLIPNVEDQLHDATKDVHTDIAEVVKLIRSLQETQVEQEHISEVRDNTAETELAAAIQKVADSTGKLKQITAPLSPNADDVDHKAEIIEASGSVTAAINQLLQATQLAQSEMKNNCKDPTCFYHTDHSWSQGLINAAQEIMSLVVQLVAVSTAIILDSEAIIALARSIAGSTAHLLTAVRVKGNPNSEAHKMLLQSAKLVAMTTSELVSKAQEAPTKSTEELPKHKEQKKAKRAFQISSTGRVDSPRTVKLEKDLNIAQQHLANLRREVIIPKDSS